MNPVDFQRLIRDARAHPVRTIAATVAVGCIATGGMWLNGYLNQKGIQAAISDPGRGERTGKEITIANQNIRRDTLGGNVTESSDSGSEKRAQPLPPPSLQEHNEEGTRGGKDRSSQVVIHGGAQSNLTEAIVNRIRALKDHESGNDSSVSQIVKLTSELAARKFSLANQLQSFIENPVLRYEVAAYANSDLYSANKLTEQILSVLNQLDPGWAASDVDKSVLTYTIFFDKRNLLYRARNQINGGELTESEIRNLIEYFNNEGKILQALATELGEGVNL